MVNTYEYIIETHTNAVFVEQGSGEHRFNVVSTLLSYTLLRITLTGLSLYFGVLSGRVVKMTGVDEILNYQKNPDDDFYGLLGCDESSTVEQITAEYKVLALQYHPDKNAGDKDAEAKFQKLKEAKETLCDPMKRALYDKWKQSGISMGYKQWLGMKDHVQQSMHWSKPNTKDRMLEDESGRSSGPSSLGPTNAAARRASEGGAALWGRWGANQEPPSEVISKFRNYEI